MLPYSVSVNFNHRLRIPLPCWVDFAVHGDVTFAPHQVAEPLPCEWLQLSRCPRAEKVFRVYSKTHAKNWEKKLPCHFREIQIHIYLVAIDLCAQITVTWSEFYRNNVPFSTSFSFVLPPLILNMRDVDMKKRIMGNMVSRSLRTFPAQNLFTRRQPIRF